MDIFQGGPPGRRPVPENSVDRFSKLNLDPSHCSSNATSLADTCKYVHAVGGSMKGVLCEVNKTHEAL